MTIQATYHVGKATLPASVPLNDQALTVLTGLFKSAILYDCQTAYAASKPTKVKWDGYVVADVVPYAIEPWLTKSVKLKFPLLSISRKSHSYSQFTLHSFAKECEWIIDYILPQTPLEDFGIVNPLLNLISASIISCIERQGHPAYLDGYSGILGSVQGGAGFWSIYLTDVSIGHWEIASETKDGIMYPVARLTLKTKEITGPGTISTDGNMTNYDPNLPVLDGYSTAYIDGYQSVQYKL